MRLFKKRWVNKDAVGGFDAIQTSQESDPLALDIRDLVLSELNSRGIHDAGVDWLQDGFRITLPDGTKVFLHDLTVAAASTQSEGRPALVSEFVSSLPCFMPPPDPKQLSEDDFRRMLRTRLLPGNGQFQNMKLEDRPYGYSRTFLGFQLILCLDLPTTVKMLNTNDVVQMPLDIDDLYRIGQINTDAEPIDGCEQLAPGVWELYGESVFIASKAAHFEALVPNVTGAAPLGVAFGLLDRNRITFAPVSLETFPEQLSSLAQINATLAARGEHPGGLISDQTFYWSPDGTTETLASFESDSNENATLNFHPGEAFSRVVLSQLS